MMNNYCPLSELIQGFYKRPHNDFAGFQIGAVWKPHTCYGGKRKLYFQYEKTGKLVIVK